MFKKYAANFTVESSFDFPSRIFLNVPGFPVIF
jgi:hypothetical protein